MELTTTQAGARLGVSERTIQRAIADGKLQARHLARNKYVINADDLERYAAQRLAEHIGQSPDLASLSERDARIAALESQVSELQSQLDTLSSAFRAFADDITSRLAAPTERLPPAPKILRPPKAEYIPSATPETGQGLPEGYSAFTEWCERHKIAETTARRKINPDNLKKGHWKDADGNLVKVAIDQAGQHHLWEIFHGKTHFQPCEQCPHS